MSFITTLSKLLLIVGGINWGFIGLFHLDVLAAFLGEMTATACTAYMLVGAAGVWLLLVMLCDAFLGPYEPRRIAP